MKPQEIDNEKIEKFVMSELGGFLSEETDFSDIAYIVQRIREFLLENTKTEQENK